MKELKIYKYQAEQIEDTLRMVNNVMQSSSRKTCLDRNVMQSWQMIKNVLAGEPDKEVRYSFVPEKPIPEEQPVKYGDYVQMDDRFESVHIWSKELEERNNGRWIPLKITKEKYEQEKAKGN